MHCQCLSLILASLVPAREACCTDYTPASRLGLLRLAQRGQRSEKQASPLPTYNIAVTTAHSYDVVCLCYGIYMLSLAPPRLLT